jgi:hypothetical protein
MPSESMAFTASGTLNGAGVGLLRKVRKEVPAFLDRRHAGSWSCGFVTPALQRREFSKPWIATALRASR